MTEERRRYTRVPIVAGAIVESEGVRAEGEVETLSVGGMLLKTSQRFEVDREIKVELILRNSSKKMITIEMLGRVVRHTEEGVAIQFTAIYLDPLSHLIDAVASVYGDRERIAGELKKNLLQP